MLFLEKYGSYFNGNNCWCNVCKKGRLFSNIFQDLTSFWGNFHKKCILIIVAEMLAEGAQVHSARINFTYFNYI